MLNVFLLATLCCLPPAPARVARLSELPATATLQIDYHTQGCFGFSRHRLSFRFGPHPAVTIEDRTPQWSVKANRFVEMKRPRMLGRVALTAGDLEGLDRWIAFYRTPSDSFSTLSHTFDLVLFDGKRPVAREHIEGSAVPEKADAMVSFDALIRRLHPQ